MKTSFRFFKCVILAIILTFVCQYSQAQFLKRLKNKITQTAADHVTNDAGNATDKAIDKTEDAAGNAAKGNDNSSSSNDNSSNSSSVSSSNSASGNSSAPASIKSYQNYDFVPGDTVLFADDFTEDQDGEFPSHWNLTRGRQSLIRLPVSLPF